MSDTVASIRALVLGGIAQGQQHEDEPFNAVALRVFRFQFEHNVPYRAFCERRDCTPGSVEHWTQIPPVPTAAFKEAVLVAGDVRRAQAAFRTSGTTRGAERRGTHHILDLSIYHAALLRSFRECVLPDGARPLMLSLVPAAADAPDSSLSHMMSTVMKELGANGSTTVVDAQSGIDYDRLDRALVAAQDEGQAVCLLGTSFAFVHWLDHLEHHRMRFRLPSGSRLMDTGGFKGRSREVDAAELRRMYGDRLGVDDRHIVNEYGMTELCSQFYDAALRAGVDGTMGPRRKVVPPWVRTRVVHPETLAPVPFGRTGILQHHDLANVFSVAAVQTEDVGVAEADGFVLHGRAPGAAPRGCSIAMDLLLESIGRKAR